MSYLVDNGGYRIGRQNGGYRRGPGQGYRRAQAAAAGATVPTTILGETATFSYDGGLAATGGWTATVGDNLSRIAVGTEPLYNQSSPYEAPEADEGVKFRGSDYFQRTGDTGFADLGTDDAIFLVAYEYTNESKILLGKFAAGNLYWEFVNITGGHIRFQTFGADGSALKDIVDVVAGADHLIGVAYDSSGSMRLYIDGEPEAGDVVVSGVGDTANTGVLTIGARTGGALACNSAIYWAGMWQAASGWLDSHDQDTLMASIYADFSA